MLREGVIAFGVRAEWDQPEIVMWPLELGELQSFAELNFRSGTAVREMVEFGMDEVWHAYDFLVAPVGVWARPGEVVCLIPHGVLHRLPLHALNLDASPIIARNPIVYSPSASLLKQVRDGRSRLGVARVTPTAAVLGDSVGDRRHARAEAELVAGLLETTPLLGAEVTRAAVAESLQQADIVHVAGHGVFDADDPLSSGLRLADGTLFTATDVFGLPSARARLITLSGCETGVSENRPGDELYGLVRAFFYNRLRAMVVSQWSVADASSGFLMNRFYTHVLGGAKSLAHALQSAMCDTIHEPSWSSIYHWAPFVLIGDWQMEGWNG